MTKLPTFSRLLRTLYGCIFTHAVVKIDGEEKTLWLHKRAWKEGPKASNLLVEQIDLREIEPTKRTISLPKNLYLDEDGLATIMGFEAEQNIPVPIDDVVWTWKETAAPEKMELLYWKIPENFRRA